VSSRIFRPIFHKEGEACDTIPWGGGGVGQGLEN
jgi:hypothetical protein